MAGSSMTFAYDKIGTIRKIIIDWTSDSATGAVSGTTKKITGTLLKGITDPGATAPTDNYDIVVTDEEGVNVLGNCVDDLANRDTSNTEEVYFLVSNLAATDPAGNTHPVVCDKLTFTITNAGNSKTGQIVIYYRHEG